MTKKRLIRTVLPVLLLLMFGPPAAAQDMSRALPADEVFRLDTRSLPNGGLELTWEIAEGYYLYREHFSAESADGDELTLETLPGEFKDDPIFGRMEIYHNRAEARLTPIEGPVKITWQGCKEAGICYPPQTHVIDAKASAQPLAEENSSSADREGAFQFGGDAALSLSDDEGLVAGLSDRGGVAFVVLGFFGFGILLALTPCVFPMIPILAGMLAGQGETLTVRRGLALAATYVVAMASAFALLGVAAAWSGQNLQVAMQSPLAIGIVAGLFALLALSMFGLFELRMPQSVADRLGRIEGRRGSFGGAAALGFTSALIVGPCVTAPLAGALLYIAKTGDLALGAAALFALGLGQGAPLLAVGLFGPRILPRSGAWMERAKQAFGVMFLGFAVWLAGRILPGPVTLVLWAGLFVGAGVFLGALDRLSGSDSPLRRVAASAGMVLLLIGGFQGAGAALGADDPLRPLGPLAAQSGALAEKGVILTSVATTQALDAGLTDAEGRPVLVYVTAEWCTTCRSIEQGPLSDPEVIAALSSLRPIKVDVTDFGRESQALLDRLGAAGPPTMVFLDEGLSEVPGTRLVGDVGKDEMLSSIRKVAR